MTKISSPKSTGAGGSHFENEVGAYFLTHLLTGTSPINPEYGTLTRIDFQTRVVGWLLDDMLLTFESAVKTRRCSLSIKSNIQFTLRSMPKDFISAAWRTYLHDGSDVFNRDSDILGLITAPLIPELKLSISNLINLARAQDPSTFHNHIMTKGYVSNDVRELFQGFSCPSELMTKYPNADRATPLFLRSMEILEFDFEHSDSSKKREAITICQNALVSGSIQEALELWTALLSIASELKPRSGYVDRQVLLGHVQHKYKLKELPFHQVDWSRLQYYTRQNLAGLQDRIIDRIKLTRDNECTLLKDIFKNTKTAVLLGASGIGKTALAKQFAETENKPTIWIQAKSLDVPDFQSFESKLGLTHSLESLLRNIASEQAFLIIDGIDRSYSEDVIKNVRVLLEQVNYGPNPNPWRIILTCQIDEWARVQEKLSKALSSFIWQLVEVTQPVDFKPIWNEFPQLKRLWYETSLKPLVTNLKILDLLVTRLSSGAVIDPTKWVGESDVVDWFWDDIVLNRPSGLKRHKFLMKLGSIQADHLKVETAVTEFDISELDPVDELIKDRICKRSSDGLISFYHDLFGDWARQRLLLSEQNVCDFLKGRLNSPLWHRAIRLFGLHLLEKDEPSNKWVDAINLFKTPELTLGQDLILEAIIFSANQLKLLEKIRPHLIADNGELFRRLLKRFIYSATRTNPAVMKLMGSESKDSEIAISTYFRIPYILYWPAMIKFLHNHLVEIENISAMAPIEVATICDLWLRGPIELPFRMEAGEIALTLGEHYFKLDHLGGVYLDHKLAKPIYRSVLAAAKEFPDRVADFSLMASGRKQIPRDPKYKLHRGKISNIRIRTEPPTEDAKMAIVVNPEEHWPQGPIYDRDHDFQDICLETDALYPLIVNRPEVAKEVILSLLIDPKEDEYTGDRFFRGFSIDEHHNWFPPIYYKGPFWSFLISNPDQAISLIIDLTNFVIERWKERAIEQGDEPPFITIRYSGTEKKWYGNHRVYYWYRDTNGPHAVVCALMALEKWFYDQMEAGKAIQETIASIIARTDCMALIGLFNALGCKDPTLFKGILQPFILVPEFIHWEFQHTQIPHNEVEFAWSYFARDEKILQEISKWHDLPHRKLGIYNCGLYLFVNDPEMRPPFELARLEWLERLKSQKDNSFLEKIIAEFDINNWDFSSSKITYVPPKALQDKNQQALKVIENNMLLHTFPTTCLQLIEKNQTLNEEQAENIWKTLKKIYELKTFNGLDNIQEKVPAGICGGTAILISLSKEWVKSNPDKIEWCKERIIEIMNNPPEREPKWHDEYSRCDWCWDRLCALVIPYFWSSEVNSKTWRNYVAQLATWHNYETIGYLVKTAFQVRSALGSNFDQLQNLIVHWARAMWLFHRTRHFEKSNDKFDIADARNNLIQAFVKDQVSKEIQPWKEIEKVFIDNRKQRPERIKGNKRHHQEPPFDIELLRSAFMAYPLLQEAVNEGERKKWINFWRECLNCTLGMIGNELKSEEEMESTPYGWDRWVLRRIAILVLELKNNEKPESFWKPILNLGPGAADWVNSFTEQLIESGLSSPNIYEFEVKWEQMILFAHSSAKWEAKKYGNSDIDKIWWSLMGFDMTSLSLWTDEHRSTVLKFKELIKTWFDKHSEHRDCIAAFCRFLNVKAADEIVDEGLVWVRDACRSHRDHIFKNEYVVQSIATLVSDIYQNSLEKLKKNRDAFAAYRDILKDLASFHNTIGMEIQNRLLENRTLN